MSDEDKKWILDQLVVRLERQEEHFTKQLEQLGERFAERLERVETRLLTEFHKWASPVELRARSHAAAIKAMDAEMEALGDRVTNIENRSS